MNAMLLLIVATLGVDFTYEFNTAGQAEYSMTIESELVPEMVQGKGVRSVIPRAALGGRILRLQVPKTNRAGLINTVNEQPLPNAVSQGVRSKADGTYEYVVQIDPASIELFKSGRPIVVSLDPTLDAAGELIIISGTERLGSFASVSRPAVRNDVAFNEGNPRNAGPTLADPATRNIGDNQVRPAQFSEQAGVNQRISIPPNALQNSPTQPRPLPQNIGDQNSSRRNPVMGNTPAANPLNNRPLGNTGGNTGQIANTAPFSETNFNNTNPLATNNQTQSNIPGVGRPLVRPLDPNPAFTNPINNQFQNFKNSQLGNNVGPIRNPDGTLNNGQLNNGQLNNGQFVNGPLANGAQPQVPFNANLGANNQFNNNQLGNGGPLATNGVNAGGWSPANPNSGYPDPNAVTPQGNNRLANLGQQNPGTNSPLANPNSSFANPGLNPNFGNPAQNNIYNQNGLANPSLGPAQNPAATPNPNWPGNGAQQNPYTQKDQQFLAALESLATKIDQIDKKSNGLPVSSDIFGTPGVHTPTTAAQAANLAMLDEMKKIADSIKTAQTPALTAPTSALKVAGDTDKNIDPKKVFTGSMSFLLLAFCLSLAANAWLAWVAWDYVERYQHLSDDVRSSRSD